MRYARRMKNMEDKELLNLMEVVDIPDIISFSGGFPSPETYPIKEIKESFIHVIDNQANEALSYSSTSGYKPLREILANRMNKRYNMTVKSDQVIITSGSQQALDISGMLFIDEGDVILFETPSYLGALNALKAYGAEPVAVPTDSEGIIIEELKKILDQYAERIKLFYVIPDFQNPTCRCWTNERRQEFMTVMGQHDIPILEDAAYSELTFDDHKVMPLFSMDKNNQVIYCGTFSKTFCPGLRVAWMCAHPDLIQKFLMLKSNVDLSSSSISQMQMVYYLKQFDYDAHIEKITNLYKQRRDMTIQKIKEHFPKEVTYEIPKGGLFLWISLPQDKDTRELLKLALKEKVSFVPGGSFYTQHEKNNQFRLNYSNIPEDKIKEGISRLGKIISEYLASE